MNHGASLGDVGVRGNGKIFYIYTRSSSSHFFSFLYLFLNSGNSIPTAAHTFQTKCWWLGSESSYPHLLPSSPSPRCHPDGLRSRAFLGSPFRRVGPARGARGGMPTLLAGALADLGDGPVAPTLGAQAGGAQLAAAGVGDAVAAAHRVAALAHAHAAHHRAAGRGRCPGFTLPSLTALHALHALRAVRPARPAAPARLALAAGAHRAAAARVAGLAQRASARGQGRAGGRLAGPARVRRGGRGEGQQQEQQQPGGRDQEQGARCLGCHGGTRRHSGLSRGPGTPAP